MMSRPPSSVDLADDGGDLRRADVEPDQVSFLACHRFPRSAVACVAARARRPPSRPLLRCTAGLHVHPLVEAQIHVVDVRHPLAQRRREIQVRLQPLEEPVLAEVQQRRVVLEQHHRVVRVADVDLRHAGCAMSLARRERRRSRAPPARRGRRRWPAGRELGGRTQAVDDRQIELRVLRAELVDHRAGRVDQIQRRCRAGRGPSAAAPTRTLRPSTAARAAAPRRRPTATPSAGGDSAGRSAVRMLDPRSPSTIACTSPLDMPHVAVHADAADLQRRGVQRPASMRAVSGIATTTSASAQRPARHESQRATPPRRVFPARAHLRAAEVLFSRRLDAHPTSPPASSRRVRSAARIRSGSVPIDPAPSVMTRSFGSRECAPRPRACRRASSRACTGTAASSARPLPPPRQSPRRWALRRRHRCRSGRPRPRRRAPSPNSSSRSRVRV